VSRRFERRGDVSELTLAWKRDKTAESEAGWRQGCYEPCEGCKKTREECTCSCTACGGLGYIVTVSGPHYVTGKRVCHVCEGVPS